MHLTGVSFFFVTISRIRAKLLQHVYMFVQRRPPVCVQHIVKIGEMCGGFKVIKGPFSIFYVVGIYSNRLGAVIQKDIHSISFYRGVPVI